MKNKKFINKIANAFSKIKDSMKKLEKENDEYSKFKNTSENLNFKRFDPVVPLHNFSVAENKNDSLDKLFKGIFQNDKMKKTFLTSLISKVNKKHKAGLV